MRLSPVLFCSISFVNFIFNKRIDILILDFRDFGRKLANILIGMKCATNRGLLLPLFLFDFTNLWVNKKFYPCFIFLFLQNISIFAVLKILNFVEAPSNSNWLLVSIKNIFCPPPVAIFYKPFSRKFNKSAEKDGVSDSCYFVFLSSNLCYGHKQLGPPSSKNEQFTRKNRW